MHSSLKMLSRISSALRLTFALLLMVGLTLSLSNGYATPPVPTPKGPTLIIQEISVVGNKKLTKAAVLKEAGHKVGDICNSDTLTDMRTHLFASGYFGGHSTKEEDAVKVTSTPTTKGKCRVTITVDENETLTKVILTGTGPLKMEEIQALIHLKAGDVYNDKTLLLDALAIQDIYRKKGYIATLNEAAVDKKGILSIPVTVTRVAEIKVVGNQKTTTESILAAMTAKSGDYLNINTLDKDQAALLASAPLKLESVKLADQAAGLGRVNIIITVVEKTD